MKFTYESKIPLTKSFLLEHYSEEQYMSYYLKKNMYYNYA